MGRNHYSEWIRMQWRWPRAGGIPRRDYDALLARFNPTKFDADAWISSAATSPARTSSSRSSAGSHPRRRAGHRPEHPRRSRTAASGRPGGARRVERAHPRRAGLEAAASRHHRHCPQRVELASAPSARLRGLSSEPFPRTPKRALCSRRLPASSRRLLRSPPNRRQSHSCSPGERVLRCALPRPLKVLRRHHRESDPPPACHLVVPRRTRCAVPRRSTRHSRARDPSQCGRLRRSPEAARRSALRYRRPMGTRPTLRPRTPADPADRTSLAR